MLAPAYGMAPAPAIDISIPEASGATARAWSNAGKRCGMAAKGQQSSRCVVDLIAILASASAGDSTNRVSQNHTADLGWRSLAPRPLTKPPRA
ncbi:hypothetical protein [Aurantimonas marianensis]|uniref:Uncharacterized protein n=1 Tax=Aurantimonas marianensis TaxID=2920428 RepID=A0A9X2HBA7_9HYPH|nr:hypothetical protein [Aurantimonas marianensis]MCP3056705.1 hypothetical protein [Aurantimonas marianensis]